MKYLFTCLFSFLFVKSFSQAVATVADPALSQMNVTDLSSAEIDPQAIPLGSIVKLDVPIYNLDIVNNLPSGSCKIKIGLGSHIVIDPLFDVNSVNSNEYFNWSAETIGGQVQLTGDLKAPLPKNYSAVIRLNVEGNEEGTSTVTNNFLITNHNTSVILSDANPSNNSTFLAYRIIKTVPVTFTKISAVKSGCDVNVAFSAENEINLKKYEIEFSKNGVEFKKLGELNAANSIDYKFNFSLTDLLSAETVYVRIKSVDLDGKYQYSVTRKLNGVCGKENGIINVYPNPASGVSEVTVNALEGIFTGKYHVSLFDISGKLLSQNELLLTGLTQFKYPVAKLAAGGYLLKLTNKAESKSAVVKITKIN